MIIPATIQGLDTNWVVGLFVAGVLLILAGRDAIHLRRIPTGHPSRGHYVFGAIVLVILSIGMVMVMFAMERKEQSLQRIAPVPPGSRFAIERMALDRNDAWVYESPMTLDAITAFLLSAVPANGGTIVGHDHREEEGGRSAIVAIDTGEEQLFVTIIDQERSRLVHYSFEGELSIVDIPGSP
jgi:hypothetical protein